MRKLLIACAGIGLLSLSACSNSGPEPTENATQVKTYRVEGLPSVTTFCLGSLGYAMATGDTLTLTRVYEADTACMNPGTPVGS